MLLLDQSVDGGGTSAFVSGLQNRPDSSRLVPSHHGD